MTDQVNEAVADRLRAVYVEAHDAEEALLEATGHAFDPYLPVDAGIRAVLREVQAHPSRGVVDEAMVERAHFAFISYDGDVRNSLRAALQAAALPAVPSDEWKDRLATALDDLGNPTGLIYFANGRVIGSRQFYIHVVHGEALPVRFADPAHQPAVPSVPEDWTPDVSNGGQVSVGDASHTPGRKLWHTDPQGRFWTGYTGTRTAQQLMAECESTIRDLRALIAATPKDQPAQKAEG